jgi:hypothetical protein
METEGRGEQCNAIANKGVGLSHTYAAFDVDDSLALEAPLMCKKSSLTAKLAH